ncbi:hypothetical protein [Cognatishimia maritima]|uniref:Tetratricopeptide repeat-containing protein n=1 Tax=Cognatishimia maritima TaxID=870908 RepID=A0A1M5I387_9RHOB|nr:hypothetical protein [Cognatishimia maritima]SHG22778.1 hypothetical protein SAMN04488044_0176 [Cognatishimia maritima]
MCNKRHLTGLAGVALALLGPALSQAEGNEPLSAIDWLGQTPTVTLHIEPESPVAEDGDTPAIDVSELDASGRDAVGLLPGTITGLPNTLWQNSRASDLVTLIADMPEEPLPALQALMYTLLLAEANPPRDAEGQDALLLARVDKLMALGAIEQANALLLRAVPDRPDLFARWFDVSLLIGEEQTACDRLNAAPHLSPGFAARIFCLARAGEWETAVLTLNTANSLRLITPSEDELLLRFLDPELFAEDPLLITATTPDMLQFRLFEAIGEPQPTRLLPRAFAHADLRPNMGWKSQLDAAERLARVGALPENKLFALYLDGKPAASGAVWDRVAAVQKVDAAIAQQDAAKLAAALPKAWDVMVTAHLDIPFARYYSAALGLLSAEDRETTPARDILLLSDSYESAAKEGPQDFLAGLAQGVPPRRAADPTRQAIADAFHGAGVPQVWTNRLARGQLGEVILLAMTSFQQGVEGDLRALTNSLATFRAVGLEEFARQAALQILLLDRGY